jgi:integrase
MPAMNKLTAVAVANMTKPGRYADGNGLYLQVAKGGTKSWLFRYMRAGKARQMGLGPVHIVPLVKARAKAMECQRGLLEGIDPIQARQARLAQTRIEAARGITFRQCAEKHIAAHEAGWRNPKHRDQWKNTLATYVYPVIGEVPADEIDIGLVLKILEPIWTSKAETAGRVRGRIEAILDWATARGYRSGENPARWRGHLDKLLPARTKVSKVRHHPAMPYADLPGFMAELRDRASISARALEFAILTAARTGEVIGAQWSEIDLGARIWTIPAERMKGGREHRVPLSDRAVEVLSHLPREDGWVFPGGRAGKPLSNMALLELMRGMRPDDGFVPHGFRSTFRDWASERTAFPHEVCEMALAHAIPNKVESAYRRGDLFEKRRRLMTEWARYALSPARHPGADVVEIRTGG